MTVPIWKRSSYRIAASTAVIFAVASLVLGGGVLAIARTHMSRSLDARIMALCDPIAALARTGNTAAAHIAAREASAQQDDHLAIVVFDRQGRRIVGDFELPRPSLGWSDVTVYDPIEGRDPVRVHAIDLPNGERMVAIGSRRPLQIADDAMIWASLGAATVVILLSAMLAVILGRTLDARLAPISRTTDAINSGQLDLRVPISNRKDEFDRVAASVNGMLDRMSQLLVSLRGIAGDIAHDLRTPLARLRSRLENASDDSTLSRQNIIDTTIESLDGLQELFSAILRVAEIEEGTEPVASEPVNLGEIAREVFEAMQPVFEDEGLKLHLHCDNAAIATIDRRQLASALVNLLENALRHTTMGTQVTINIARKGQSAVMEVLDTGPGVPDAHLHRIFDRFVRLDTARGAPGHGLGLSLVRAIATANGGSVRAGNKAAGFYIQLIFPLTASKNGSPDMRGGKA